MRVPRLGLLTFYQEAYAAVTDFQFYRSIFQQPITRSLFYLFWLAVHSALVATLAYSSYQLPSVLDFLQWAELNFPPLTVSEGVLTVQGEQPIVREYLGEKVYTFVFDTTEEPIALHRLNQPAAAFTRENLHLLLEGQTHTWPWSQSSPWHLGKAEIAELRSILSWGFVPFGLLLFGILAFLGKAIQALLLTFISVSASTRQLVRLPFSNYVTLTIYSLTPAVALDLAVTALGQPIPLFSIIYWATAAIFAYFSTHRCVALES